jgi:hypothetical protein
MCTDGLCKPSTAKLIIIKKKNAPVKHRVCQKPPTVHVKVMGGLVHLAQE